VGVIEGNLLNDLLGETDGTLLGKPVGFSDGKEIGFQLSESLRMLLG